MIWFDVTRASSSTHASGLMRVSRRLREELGSAVRDFAWPDHRELPGPDDWLITAELFDEAERPGIAAFLANPPCRLAAIYYDAIPLKLPHLTWPRSVARHPEYMKLLACFHRVWAISVASRDELLGYWNWLGVVRQPPVDVLPMGADFGGQPRRLGREEAGREASVGRAASALPHLAAVGILEPRKNQDLLLDVCLDLWDEGLAFELHVAGRVNPHFGRPIEARLKKAASARPGLCYHRSASDALLARIYASARATVVPTIAEGCGLPVLESLWLGVPCVCSDLPPLMESAAGGGCLPVAVGDRAEWKSALRRILTDDALHARLAAEALSRPLATWSDSARALQAGLV